MMHRNYVRPTAEEKRRMDRMMRMGCVLTWLKFGVKETRVECHHLTVARKRLGHWWTIPLTPWYHRGDPGRRTKEEMLAEFGPPLTRGSKVFVREHGYTEMDLWLTVQHALDLPDELPKSKILPRRNVA